MAISLVQTVFTGGSSATGTTSTLTLGNTTTGNTLIVFIANEAVSAGTVSSVTDSLGNAYNSVGVAPFANSNPGEGLIYYAANITGGTAPVITIHWAANGQGNIALWGAREYSGLDPSPFDKAAGTTGNSAALNSGATATTTQSSELVVGFGWTSFGSNPYTVGSGFGNLVTNTTTTSIDGAIEDKQVGGLGTQTATFTAGNSWNWGAIVATFKALVVPVSGSGAYTPVILASKHVGPMALRRRFHTPRPIHMQDWPAAIYSRASSASAPTTNAQLATPYSAAEITTVSNSSNTTDVTLTDTSTIGVHEFQTWISGEQRSETISITWKGNVSSAASTVFLQIYNLSTSSWETLSSNASPTASTIFTLTGAQSTNQQDYIDANGYVYCRVYQ